jgi:hypothetical protein
MTYAALVQRFFRLNRKFRRIFILDLLGLIAIHTICAAAHAAWALGWGYSWEDAQHGLIMLVLGSLFWIAWNGMVVLVGGLNEIFFGPDPDRVEEPKEKGPLLGRKRTFCFG